MKLAAPQPQNPSLLQQILEPVNLSFLLGILLGVFLKMIIEYIAKRLSRIVRSKTRRIELNVYTDYTCEVTSDGTIKPLEPHLIIKNTSNERLTISRIEIQYGQRNAKRIFRGLVLQSNSVLYSSPLIQTKFELESKADMKVFVRTRIDSIEITDTKPKMQLDSVKLDMMPADVMRYAAFIGTNIIGESGWFERTSIRPRLDLF
jgi:hypothetical protein